MEINSLLSGLLVVCFPLNDLAKEYHKTDPGHFSPTLTMDSLIQIKSVVLAYEAVKTTLDDQVGWWGCMGMVAWVRSFLHGAMCAEGMGCGRRWIGWVLWETGIASGHPGVS